MLTVNTPTYMDDKGCLLKVQTHEDSNIHQSWLLPGNEVIVYENIPENYPAGALCIYKSITEYIEAIKDVSWINDSEYIMKNNMPEGSQFPFGEEEGEKCI